ncbi:catecholate siderophore receptor Fiu [Rheinheimera sp. MM224]|uniref:catecholate siderophore receptor Fiu n=1 Tax=Rheinheimera sp. MM224 TaxID=3019969 RepID=UPI0021F90F43|nr:catecholate siderophore receptor Fiu [Rheinheimera sp. MM224]CAI3801942.1 Catecholate siderophore receptor Fiu [Rheinheimera sp. MM224]
MAFITAKKHQQVARFNTTLLASAFALALPATATADQQNTATQNDTQLDAVVVTADAVEAKYKAEKASSTKLTQPLVNTPQTLVVVKKELFQQQAATTLSDTLRNTPGITMLMGENGNTATGDSIFMRGFDTQGSIFVDSIRDLGTISRDTFNTEQVEIAKGPAGADNGRGSSSGYINLSSKQATQEEFTTGNLTLGSGSHKRATVDLNRQLSDTSAIRVNLLKQDSGVVDRDEVEDDKTGIATSLALGLGTTTRAYLNLFHVDQKNLPDGGIPTVGLEGYYNAAFDADPSTNFPNGGPNAGKTLAPVDTSNFYGSKNDFDDVKATMVTAKIEHDLNDKTTIRNTSRFGQSTQDYLLTGVNAITTTTGTGAAAVAIADPADWTISRSRQGKDQRNQILTNQTQLTTSVEMAGLTHDISSGIEFIYESQRNNTLALPAGTTQVAANLYNPSTDDAFVNPVHTGASTDGSTLTSGIYVLDTIHLNEQWQLNASARFEHYKTETDTVTIQGTSTPQNIPVGTKLGSAVEASDNLASYKLGALYKPAANGSAYLSYATSQLPPGGANFTLSETANNINNPNLDPQKGTNLELGTKWDLLNEKLAVTAAVFESTNENEIATDPDGTALQVGERQVRGIELGVVGAITSAWQISAGAAYMDSEITRGNQAGTNPTDGGVIQWTPEVTFTLWNTYELPIGLTLGGGVRYVDTVSRSSSTTVNLAKTSVVEVPEYWVVDAMASYPVTPYVDVQLNVYNLLDEEYMSALNNGGSRYYLGTPRSFRLGVNVQF